MPIDGASDHGVSEAIYLRDPDDNGLEIYRDRDPAEWPRDADGVLSMTLAPLDLHALLAELTPDPNPAPSDGPDDGTTPPP